MMNITPDQFYKLLVENIGKYDKDVQQLITRETDEVSQGIKPELQSYSTPKPKGHLLLSGGYKRGWSATTLQKNGVYRRRVYNKAKPTLVHLLEFGHAGPYPAKAYPHVRKTEQKYSEILFKRLKEGIDRL